MAVDRSLNLRPGVLDIADIVDNLLEQLEPTVYTAQDLTFLNDFEQYSTSADNVIRITKVGNAVYIKGAIKPTQTIPANQATNACNLPSACVPTTSSYFVEQGSQMNRYCLKVSSTGVLEVSRYGTNTNSQISAGAWLRIDCSYRLD